MSHHVNCVCSCVCVVLTVCVRVCVCRYYSDIHSAASGCYQEMNSTLTELSGVSKHKTELQISLSETCLLKKTNSH